MAKLNVIKCDRCGTEVRDDKKIGDLIFVTGSGVKRYDKGKDGLHTDLCERCTSALAQWLSRDNTTSAGYPPVGKREQCPHHVPCAGPCPSGYLADVN